MRTCHVVISNKTTPSALFIQLRTYQFMAANIVECNRKFADENPIEVKWRQANSKKKKQTQIFDAMTSVCLV